MQQPELQVLSQNEQEWRNYLLLHRNTAYHEVQRELPELQSNLLPEGEDARQLPSKTHSCTYCGQIKQNMGRHLELVHDEEPDVAKIIKFTKNSAERCIAFDGLLKEGDFKHNNTVLKEGKGVVIPKYRSVEGANVRYIPCEYCKGFYSKNGMRHQKACKKNKTPS